MSEDNTLIITAEDAEEYQVFYQELKLEYPNAYWIHVDSFGSDSFTQIVIPLSGVFAGSSVLSILIAKIFDRNVIDVEYRSVDGDSWKYSGHKDNLPKALENVEKQAGGTEKQV